MNERIKQLAEQSALGFEYDEHPKCFKRFTELIVKELETRLRFEGELATIQAVVGSTYKYAYMNEAANIVKKHFGVEE